MDSPDSPDSTSRQPAPRRRRPGPAMAVLAILAAASCDADPFVPDAEAAIEGLIVSLTGANGPLDEGFMHVKTEPVEEDPCGIIFRVEAGTDILLRSGGVTRAGDPADLRVGRLVKVWAFGGVAESCPGQAGADVIEIDDDFMVEPLAIRTSATQYSPEPYDRGLRVVIPYVLANLTDDDVYLAIGFEGSTYYRVEKRVEEEWEAAWSPVYFGCLGCPPVVIPPGRSVSRELELVAHFACDCGPRFIIDEPGETYRIVLTRVFATYDEERNDGESLPLEMRVSNPFEIR